MHHQMCKLGTLIPSWIIREKNPSWIPDFAMEIFHKCRADPELIFTINSSLKCISKYLIVKDNIMNSE